MRVASYRKQTSTIPIGETLRIERGGDFFHVIAANQDFGVGWDNGPITDFFAGLEYEVRDGDSFQTVNIENRGDAVLTISYGTGKGGVRDGRLTVTGLLNARDASPDVLTTGAAISATNAATTLLAAANTLRRSALVINTGGATVYVGGNAGATAAQGIPVLAGQSLTLDTKAALYARNDSGGALAVSVTELEFSL